MATDVALHEWRDVNAMHAGNRWDFAKFVSYEDMLKTIETQYTLERLQDHANDTSKVGCLDTVVIVDKLIMTLLQGMARAWLHGTSWIHYLDVQPLLRLMQPTTADCRRAAQSETRRRWLQTMPWPDVSVAGLLVWGCGSQPPRCPASRGRSVRVSDDGCAGSVQEEGTARRYV